MGHFWYGGMKSTGTSVLEGEKSLLVVLCQVATPLARQ